MINFFFLVPLAIGMGLVALVAFLWSLRHDQYDDLDGAAQRILFQDDEGPAADGAPSMDQPHPKRARGSAPARSP